MLKPYGKYGLFLLSHKIVKVEANMKRDERFIYLYLENTYKIHLKYI